MSIIRQDIFDAVQSRFQGIQIVSGYRTDYGLNVYKWRETSQVTPDEMPCILIADTSEEPELFGAGRACSEKRSLTVEYFLMTDGTDTNSITTSLRKAQADIEDAIRADTSWGNLARWTVPKGNQLGFPPIKEQGLSDLVGVISSSFEIEYRTAYFNPES